MWATVFLALLPLVAFKGVHGRMLSMGERCEPRGRQECGHGMVCEEKDFRRYECTAAPMCITESIKKKEDIKSGRLQDADPSSPQCDDDGNYKARQCYRTPFSSKTYCNCVDKYTGRSIRGHDLAFESGRDPDMNMTCACAQRRAIYLRQGDNFPMCEEKTGNYQAVRCGDKSCACVDFHGKMLADYRVFTPGGSKCLCARDLYAYSLLQIIGLRFNCDEFGQYDPIQCVGSVCFCADERGQKRTEIPSVPVHLTHTLRC